MRRVLSLTQEQLAAIIGLHRNHLGSVEVGEQPTRGIATIARIAHGLTERIGSSEPLLPLFAQAFTGEVTLAHVGNTVFSKSFGPPDTRNLPP